MLSPKSIQEFKNIYKEVFGEELSDREAFEIATKFMKLFTIIYKPMKGNKNEKIISPKH